MNRFSIVFSYKYWIYILFSIALIASCKAKGVSAESVAEQNNNPNLQKATIVDYTDKEKGCSFLIVLEKDGSLLQAIEIPEELKKNNTKILIDYLPSRRHQGSCLIALPITINEIKKRDR